MEMFFANEYLANSMGSTPASIALYRKPNEVAATQNTTSQMKSKKAERKERTEEKIMQGFASQI